MAPFVQTFCATVVRTTRAAVTATYDASLHEPQADGFTGAEVTLWYCDGQGADSFVPFDVGDVIQIRAVPVPLRLRGVPQTIEPVATNVRGAGGHGVRATG